MQQNTDNSAARDAGHQSELHICLYSNYPLRFTDAGIAFRCDEGEATKFPSWDAAHKAIEGSQLRSGSGSGAWIFVLGTGEEIPTKQTKTARIFYDVKGYYVCDDAGKFLDTRGHAYPTKAEALRAALCNGYTHAVGSGCYRDGAIAGQLPRETR